MAEYIEPEELAALLQDPTKKAKQDYLVIDVRSDDYPGGHIPNGVNIPAGQFRDYTNYLLTNYAQVPVIVVHCALSQVRGPKVARILREALASHNAAQGLTPAPSQVRVLRGGITRWIYHYHNNPALVTDYQPDLWQ
ncbi:Cdc25 phosphatase Ibp1 [Dispira parvispora]|uniref:Cdc25 phosphatase Ibp1 n=1 Tax=Dispira parvispora TaxID=1520584 RepID=A0A9W8ATV7_9FUNG|nr:Cdc25 phosphatase Ibp1 [Dispira parvispora]